MVLSLKKCSLPKKVDEKGSCCQEKVHLASKWLRERILLPEKSPSCLKMVIIPLPFRFKK